ncbi:MAG: hypothetical protein JWL74_1056 [Alphaproteobacteria bacterium]|jgi:hypothetical protein|nr:hypothetical protein [Alphaproteobacteria bacterium]
MRTIALSLASAGLLALTACGGASEANNSSANTLGAEALPPLDNGVDFNSGAVADLNAVGNGSVDADVNASANASSADANASNSVGNSH